MSQLEIGEAINIRYDLTDLLRHKRRIGELEVQLADVAQKERELAFAIAKRFAPGQRYVFKTEDNQCLCVWVHESGGMVFDSVERLGML